MMVVTMLPVLAYTFKAPAEEEEVAEETKSNGVFIALGVAFFCVMLLACAFFPCNARPSRRKYLN